MGKISSEDRDKLLESGVLSKKAQQELNKRNMVSKSSKVKRFMKTKDGKYVEPKLYFRGSTGTIASVEMIEFQNSFNELLNKYTVKMENKSK